MTGQKKIRTVIIDDEEPARNLIRRHLDHYPDIEVIEECVDGYEGARTITQEKPDLIFLDVQMPRINGFEMLELIEEKPVIIFSTAYHEYAIRAFEVAAADFLLKPYDRERFDQALVKALNLIRQGKPQKSVEALNRALRQSDAPLPRIVVRHKSEIIIIPVEHVMYINAQDDYVEIVSKEGKFLKKQTLGFYETRLPADKFIRIHRSTIVNISQIHRLELYAKNSYHLLLHDHTILPVSRTGMQRLKEKLHL